MGKDIYCATTVSLVKQCSCRWGGGVSKKANRPNQTVSPCARKCGGKGDAGDQLDGISRDYQPRSRNAAQGEFGTRRESKLVFVR